MDEYRNRIINGSAEEELKKIPDNLVNCIITSPPYWGLRDYEADGQIGLEESLDEYIERLLLITGELKRVLREDGILYWVHGDSYSRSMSAFWKKVKGKELKTHYQPKCLILQNWRLVLRMIDEQGWILRNVIIWSKPNHMPQSVTDRLTNSYEPVFMFVKNKRYYFDLDSIRLPHKFGARCGTWTEYQDHVRGKVNEYHKSQKTKIAGMEGKGKTSYPKERAENFGSPRARVWREVENDEEEIKKLEKQTYGSVGKRAKLMLLKGKTTTTIKRRLEDVVKYLRIKLKESGLNVPKLAQITGLKETTISHYFRADIMGQALPDRSTWETFKPILGLGEYDDYIKEELRTALPNPHPLGKNPGDVWEISTQPAPPEARGKHFALFPEKLIIPMILAGCPVGGLVLDPFMGAGTTAVVAKKLGRNYLGIEINPEFVEIAEKRLKKIPENLFNGNV